MLPSFARFSRSRVYRNDTGMMNSVDNLWSCRVAISLGRPPPPLRLGMRAVDDNDAQGSFAHRSIRYIFTHLTQTQPYSARTCCTSVCLTINISLPSLRNLFGRRSHPYAPSAYGSDGVDGPEMEQGVVYALHDHLSTIAFSRQEWWQVKLAHLPHAAVISRGRECAPPSCQFSADSLR